MTRTDLQNCRKAALARDALRRRIRELREDARGISGVRYGGASPKSKGEPASRQQRYVEVLEQLAAQYAEAAASWAQQVLAVEEALSVLPPDLQELMRLRYVEGRKWEEIDDHLYISRQTSFRMEKKARQLPKVNARVRKEWKLQ